MFEKRRKLKKNVAATILEKKKRTIYFMIDSPFEIQDQLLYLIL